MTVHIKDIYLQPIYNLDLSCGWMLVLYKPLIELRSWIGSACDLFRCVNKCRLLHMSWNCLRQFEFIEYNLFRFRYSCRESHAGAAG